MLPAKGSGTHPIISFYLALLGLTREKSKQQVKGPQSPMLIIQKMLRRVMIENSYLLDGGSLNWHHKPCVVIFIFNIPVSISTVSISLLVS